MGITIKTAKPRKEIPDVLMSDIWIQLIRKVAEKCFTVM